ncbi:MAG: ABC transporter substrate-binding protein [Dehalococcoidia bacterium]|nr:ABC transporter substrate-binding protein [Dehalococcoidia bacterium]
MALRNGLVFSLVMVAVLAVLAACGETVVEVPVEKVVEVEVPVEKVVEVEVPVEKVVEIEVPVVKNLIVNNLQECVTSYDQQTDYFPDKTEAQYAREWWVEYFDNYKVVTVDTDRSPDAQNLIRYVLVQCGTPEPELSGDLADAMVVEVPVQRFWEGGGGTFAALSELGVLDRLIGVNRRTSGHENHFLPDVVARVTQDDIFEETSYGDDLELILNGDPDVYFQYNGDDWRNNALQVGVPAIHYSPFSEGPLGSAEQVKFVSLFFNLEARANRYFEPIADEYNKVKAIAQSQSASPVVLLGTIARSGQFQSRNRTRLESVLIEDAGGSRPLLKAVDQGLLDGTASLGFGGVAVETALEHGQDAEYWFDMAYIPSERTVPEFLDRNPLNGNFAPMTAGNAFHRYGRAADYHSTGAVRADILLKDIVSIIHPGLLPNHRLVFLDRIETAAEIGIIASNPQGPVEEYAPGADYFPDKVDVKWAEDWAVSYHGNYKIVHMGPVGDANAGSRETYVLVQKGTPAPELTGNLAGAQIVPIPVERVYENSRGASLVTALEHLGEAESLIGLGYLPSGDVSKTTPELAQRYESDGFLVTGAADSWEPVVEAEPDLVVVPFNASQRETARSLGLPAVFYNSFWEVPLGSAEHLKFWSLFFNKEEKANELFAPVEEAYVALAEKVASAVPTSERTVVLHGQIFSGKWHTRGPDYLDYHLIRDAGGTPMLIDEGIALDAYAVIAMESVLDVIEDADFFLNDSHNAVYPDLDFSNGDDWVDARPLYSELDPLLKGNAFHKFKPGNDDYYKTAVNYRVDLLLRDLVSILHPELLDESHETVWLELITPPSQ